MGYRTILEAKPETVQDLELSAKRRLDEAFDLYRSGRFHTAIYIAGLAAEMYLKTACFFLEGAKPADNANALMAPLKPNKYKPSFIGNFESGHGLLFWSQELLDRRKNRGLSPAPVRFIPIISSISSDWFIAMRYRPGSATKNDAAQFILKVECLANDHAVLRR